MGRVFDAMRRHSATDNNGNAAKATPKSEHRNDSPVVTELPSAEKVEEQLLSGSTIMSVPGKTVRSSASTAHTADVPDGSALPGGIASRDAGATLGAAEATRGGGFITFATSPLPRRASLDCGEPAALRLHRAVSLVADQSPRGRRTPPDARDCRHQCRHR